MIEYWTNYWMDSRAAVNIAGLSTVHNRLQTQLSNIARQFRQHRLYERTVRTLITAFYAHTHALRY